MTAVRVLNLATQQELIYTCEPRQAVICAYAQVEKRDFNTWQYTERYSHLVEEGLRTWLLGDWTALKQPTNPTKKG